MSARRFTAVFCREQEAAQRAKAASEPLENRRKIALAAAKAWAAEALTAERHEAGDTPLSKLDAGIALEFAREAELPADDHGVTSEFSVADESQHGEALGHAPAGRAGGAADFG